MCEKSAVDGITHPKCRRATSLDGLISFFHYNQIAKKAIKEIKYRFVSDIVSSFVSLGDKGQLHRLKPDVVLVPVPLHPARFRFRGFNQANLITDILGKRNNFPVINDLLIRTKETIPQVAMINRMKRLNNMNGVFDLNPNYKHHIPLSIVLIDDVFTTGATLSSACRTLKKEGAVCVWGLTLAR